MYLTKMQIIRALRELPTVALPVNQGPALSSQTITTTSHVELSIVVPMYNEEQSLDAFFERLIPILDHLNITYEIICINDGSRDNTLAELLKHQNKNTEIKIIDLSRNFKKEIALSAGIDYTQGAAVVPIDVDLQDPPELIEQLLSKWREGYDVVYATRRTRKGETFIKRLTSNLFYHVLGYMSEVNIPKNTGDFRLMDKRVVEAISQMPERTRCMKGLFAWVGFKQTAIIFDREPRKAGQSKWNYWRLWNNAIDGIASFSTLPMRVWSYIGFVLSLGAMLYAGFLILHQLFIGTGFPGYYSIMVVILFLGGIQLITIGIIGEYIGRIYTEVKERPLYLVRDIYGFEENNN